MDSVTPPARPPWSAGPVLLLLLVALGYASATFWLAFFGLQLAGLTEGMVLAFPVAGVVGGVCLWLGFARRGRGIRVAYEVLILVVLVVWGIGVNQILDKECFEHNTFRLFASEYLPGLVAVHCATVVAYVVARRRPEALHPPAEVLVHALLLVGIVLQVVVAVQFGSMLFWGILLPLAMPALAPLMTIPLFGAVLLQRLRRRGAERPLPPWVAPIAGYREPSAVPPDQPPTRPLQVHWPLFFRALAASPVLLGVYVVGMRLFFGEWSAAARVFTQTCGHTLSQLPILPSSDHYLCTVAARGHTSLVRPERLGVRRGHVILVNRQLAVANAFEDLLHVRWPRLGRTARRTYDRVGLPVSRWIRGRWMADAVYLAMKPAEWAFYLYCRKLFHPGQGMRLEVHDLRAGC